MKILGIITRIPLYYILFRGLYGRYIIDRFLFMMIAGISIFPINVSIYKKLKLYKLNREVIIILFGIILFWITFLTIGNRYTTTNLSMIKFILEVPTIIGTSMFIIILYNLCNQSLYDEIWWIFLILWVIIISSIWKEFSVELLKNPSVMPRIKGSYGNPNQTALFLNLYLLAIRTYINHKLIHSKLIPIINYLTGISILLTLSRSGMICFMLINILFLNKEVFKNKMNILKIFLTVFITLVIITIMTEKLGLYIGRWSLNDGAGENGRIEALVSGFRMFLKHPIFGVGLDRAVHYSMMYGAPLPMKPHNTIVLILAETGIIPAMILISIIGYILWLTYKYKFINTFRLTLLLIVMSVFNHNLHLYTVTWISLILIIIYDFRKMEEGKSIC